MISDVRSCSESGLRLEADCSAASSSCSLRGEQEQESCRTGVAETVTSSTKQKLNSTQVQVLEQLLRDCDIKSASIVITNPLAEGNPIIHVTDPWQEMCGFSYEGAMGLNPRVVQGDNTDEEVVSRMKGALKSNCPCKVMLVNYRSGDMAQPFWNMLTISPVLHGGKLQLYMANLQDYSYHIEKLVALTPAQFCRSAEHYSKRTRRRPSRKSELAVPAMYEMDDETELMTPPRRDDGGCTIKRLCWSQLTLEPEHLVERVADALVQLQAQCEIMETDDGNSDVFIVMARLNDVKCRLTVMHNVQSGTYSIVCTRVAGDTFAYHSLHRRLRELLRDAVEPTNTQGALMRSRSGEGEGMLGKGKSRCFGLALAPAPVD